MCYTICSFDSKSISIMRPTYIWTQIEKNCSLQCSSDVSLNLYLPYWGKENWSDLLSNWPVPSSPIHLSIPIPCRACRGFSTITAFLLCSPTHPALLPSISLFTAYSRPSLPASPILRPPVPAAVTPAFVSSALALSWTAVWEWGHCCCAVACT